MGSEFTKADNKKESVLLVDDDPLFVALAARKLKDRYRFYSASSVTGGLKVLQRENIDLALLDLDIDGSKTGGLKALSSALEIKPDATYVILTGTDSRQLAVQAIRRGARDYLVKGEDPRDLDILPNKIQEFLSERQQLRIKDEFLEHLDENFGVIIGDSDAIRKIRHQVETLGKQPSANVLITGESGTGKEVVAQALHVAHLKSIQDKTAPFIPVNVAELRGEHLHSALFGHRRGSFTGATDNRSGYFRDAGCGTLFLDEIGEMSADDQSRMLRAIETSKAVELGGKTPYEITSRIHFGTNRNLEKAVEEGAFRQDLYFRISVFGIHLPPLRDRKEDIPKLVRHFLANLNKSDHRCVSAVSAEAMEQLMSYDWPGNVRELYNVIRRGYASEPEHSECLHLPGFYVKKKIKLTYRQTKSLQNLKTYLEAYHRNNRNMLRASRELGIWESTLRRPLKELFKKSPPHRFQVKPIGPEHIVDGD